jgi:hypothetical protein
MSVIYLAYDILVHISVIFLVYDMNIFWTKLVFISCRMVTWHPSVLQIYRMSLSTHGVYFRLAAPGEHRGGFGTCGPGARNSTTTTRTSRPDAGPHTTPRSTPASPVRGIRPEEHHLCSTATPTSAHSQHDQHTGSPAARQDETAAIGVELGGILSKGTRGFMVPKRVLIVVGVLPLVFVTLITNSLCQIHLPR